MGFKLGTERQPYAVSGEIKTKLRFHKESGDPDASVPGTPVVRKPLEEGVMGEANMDGTIYINELIEPDSRQERKTINGKDMIIVDGVAKEAGSEDFPWEKEANNGNDNGTV